MTLRDAFAFAAENLMKNPVRTVLTVLGLGVGIGAILTVLTLGSAGEEQVEYEIARLGVDKVWISAEADNQRAFTAADSALVSRMTDAPVCAGTATVGPVLFDGKTLAAQIAGYDRGVTEVHQPKLTEGRFFTGAEFETGAAVAVVDERMAESLGGDACGKRIMAGSRALRIVGVIRDMAQAGAASGTVILPLRTYMDTYVGTHINELTVSVPRGRRAEEVGEEAVQALAQLGGRYRAASLQEEIDAARSVVRIFVLVLACVAAVCMLTGAIGVMNILLVSVRERRREIGLLKAVGGTAQQVGMIFLLEALCYTCLGCVLGLALGAVMIRLFGALIGLDAALSAQTVLPAVLAACGLGLLFGVAPALGAARLPPVDALRSP